MPEMPVPRAPPQLRSPLLGQDRSSLRYVVTRSENPNALRSVSSHPVTHRPARTGFSEPARGPVDNRRELDPHTSLSESRLRPASRALDRPGVKPWTDMP